MDTKERIGVAVLEEKKQTYLRKSGVRCINCGSYDIEGGSVEIDGGGASQDVACTECWSTWTDLYVISDVVNIEITDDFELLKLEDDKND